MKKFGFVVTLILLASMVLAACSSGNNEGNENNENGAAGTPNAMVTGTVVPGLTGTPSGAAGAAAATATVATGNAQATATTAGTPGTVTPTTAPAANGAAVTGTPAAAVPVTGQTVQQCSVNAMKDLFGYDVVDTQGNKVGSVADVVLLRDASQAMVPANQNGMNNSNGKAANGAANAAKKPAATFGKNALPEIGYIAVNFDNLQAAAASSSGAATAAPTTAANAKATASSSGAVAPTTAANAAVTPTANGGAAAANAGNVRLVPFKAFKGLGVEKAAETTANATPATKATPAATTQANAAANNGCSLVLTVKPADYATMPAVDLNNINAEGWNKELNGYWANKGLVVPVTGATGAQMGAPVVLGKDFSGVKVVDTAGNELGSVDNFIFDANGAVKYAILKAGGFLGLGAKYIPVPFTHITWVPDDKANAGNLVVDINQADWKSAPTFDSADSINTGVAGWDKAIAAYWQNLQAPVSK